MALVFVPALLAVVLIVATNLGGSLVATTCSILFAVLAAGLVFGLMRLARKWEDETL